MFASPLFTLFIVPVAYTLLDDAQNRMGILLKKRKPQ